MVKQSIKSIVAAVAVTLFMAGATLGRAQNYPVQAFAMLTPPYSLKLSDYAAPEGNRMRINLLLKDALQPSLDVRLRLVIEGNGVRLATKPAFNPQPITLLSNSLYEVSYDQLSEYFLPQNLTAEGISMSALVSTGRLPEGLYKFKVEALEAHRDVPVSNTAVAIGWLMLNDPPQWLSPRPGQKLTAGMPQGVQLSWSRCGMSSPNAALSTQYEVTLVEMTQPGMDPNVAITTLQPLYQDVSPTENLFYGPDKPELIPGNTYAVRVRAFDTRGYDLYRNGGLSPVTTFRFGEPCVAPTFLQADKLAEQSANLSWNTPPLATSFFVRYRENGADLSDWYEDQATEATFTLKNLKPDRTYEYQVQSMCGTLPSDYSSAATLKTKKLQNLNQSCSEKLATANMPTNRAPLPALRSDETFFAGVMPVKVTSVKGGNGTFTGTGDVYLPIVGVALTCSFKDVGINTDYQLISGEVVTTRSFNGELFGDGGDQPVKDTVHLTNPIDTIITSPGGDVTIIAGKDTIRIPIADQPVVIYPPGTGTGTVTPGTTAGGGSGGTGSGTTGEGGGGPLIVEGGTVKPYTPTNFGISSDLPTAFFHKASGAAYGYDSLAYQALRTYYPVATIHGKEVDIPYKALAVNMQDNVELELKPGSTALTLDSLTFDVPGSALKVRTVKINNQRMRVTLQGVSEGSDPLAATYTRKDSDGKPEQVDIGIAQLVTYQPQAMKLVVVPLAGTEPSVVSSLTATLKTELNAIYNQAVCSWSVDVVAPFAYTLPTEGLKYGSSETMSSYTAEMNALIDAYKTANPSLPDDTYFLFVVPAITDGVNGYMPRARSFGFIAKASASARTIAHELGHGAFNLSHTFPLLPKATTDNLMDYNEGSRLIKPQWDLIHNPELTTGLLDDESDGALIVENCFKISAHYEEFKQHYQTLNKFSLYKKVFNIINESTKASYCFSELEENSPVKHTESDLGLTGHLLPNKDLFIIGIRNSETGDIVGLKFLDMQTVTHAELLKGIIYLKMETMNSKTIFHEMNHAAQFMLNKFEYRPYTSALQEVETRMILFYQVFLLASPEIRKDRVKMVELLKAKYKGSSIDDLLPLTGDFYKEKNSSYNVNSKIDDYFKQNKIEYKRQAVYQIIYDWFSANDKNTSVNIENFNILMQFYAEWLTGPSFNYDFDPHEFKPDYYLFDKLK